MEPALALGVALQVIFHSTMLGVDCYNIDYSPISS